MTRIPVYNSSDSLRDNERAAMGAIPDSYLGPWQFTPRLSASENHRGFAIMDANRHHICEVSPRDEDGIEGTANARLIASAPSLLAALEALTERCASMAAMLNSKNLPAYYLDAQPHMEAAHAAIARARGEAADA